ncbi:mib1 [Symbiodinium natans]|uniref:Mib1 protein n=1 Tax=Symbiodinium natans TaxID=878477 RepID=A0A812HQM3_9DINO|nr:mib1 [Symbiodinium natans]
MVYIPLAETVEKMFTLLENSRAATANGSGLQKAGEVPLWLFVMRQFLLLVPRDDLKEPNGKIGAPVPIAPGALREAGTCALATMRHLCDHSGPEAGNSALEELLAVLKQEERGSAALLAWVSATVAALAADGRTLCEVVVQATATGTAATSGRPTGSASLLPSLGGLLMASARGKAAARPPTSSALAVRVACGLLSSLRQLPATARNGAGGGTTTPSGDGGSRGRVTLRDGHIAVGDVVRLHNDLERAKREQEPPEHFGGWCDRMAFCLDFPGRVVEIPRRSPRMPEVLRISHGALGCWCWNARAVAEVIEDAGLLPFEEDECGPGAALTIGDEVRIDVTVDEAKQLQVNHGGWNDRMTQCCGRVGRLEAIDKAGDMKVLVPGAGAFVWNPRALRSLHAQRWESALCERLCGSIEGTLPLSLLAALTCLGCRLDADGVKAAYAELATDAQSSQDGGFQGWMSLATAALLVDPCRAAESLDEAQNQAKPLERIVRPSALPLLPQFLSSAQGRTAGSNATTKERGSLEASLSQLLQGWWQELPAWERRARAV